MNEEYEQYDMDAIAEEMEAEIAPAVKFTLLIFLSDLFTNLGNFIEHLATFPNDIALRIQGHMKWREGKRTFVEDAAREIERMTDG